jgi:O-antigen ligase
VFPNSPFEIHPLRAPFFRRPTEWAGGALAVGALLASYTTSSVPVSLALLGVVVAGLSARPLFGLSLLAASLPFYLHSKPIGSMSFSPPELILLSTLAAVAANSLREAPPKQLRRLRLPRRASVVGTPLDGPVTLFLAAALLSLLASEVMRVSLRELRTVVLEPVIGYYLGVRLLRSSEERAEVVVSLLLGGTLVALYGIYQYLFTDQVTTVEGVRRIQATYLSPNNLALYLGRLLPMVFALALFVPAAPPAGAGQHAPWLSGMPAAIGRRAPWGVAMVLAAAILLTFSVGSWMAAILSLLTVAFLWKPRAGLYLLGACAAGIAAGVPLLSLERVSSHLSLSRGTSFIRVHLWQSAVQMVMDHPLLGVGMDNFLYLYRTTYLRPEAAAEPNLSHPHNLLLGFWLEMGLAGVVAAGWLGATLLRLWRRCWRAAGNGLPRGLLAGLAGSWVDLVAHGMVDSSYFLVDLAFHFWLSAALLVAIDRELSQSRRIG